MAKVGSFGISRKMPKLHQPDSNFRSYLTGTPTLIATSTFKKDTYSNIRYFFIKIFHHDSVIEVGNGGRKLETLQRNYWRGHPDLLNTIFSNESSLTNRIKVYNKNYINRK